MSDDKESQYELVFEGPGDGSADTLRKLKGAMVADLEMSVAEVQHILESYPLTIKRSESSQELAIACQLLKSAGGSAYIIQPKTSEHSVPPEGSDEFQLEIDLDEMQKEAEPKGKVFELDMDPDEDNSLAKVLSEFKEDFGFNTDVPTLVPDKPTTESEPFNAAEKQPPSPKDTQTESISDEQFTGVAPERLQLKLQSEDETEEKIEPAPQKLSTKEAEAFSSGGWTLELDDDKEKKAEAPKEKPTRPAEPPQSQALSFELLDEETVSAEPIETKAEGATTDSGASAVGNSPALSLRPEPTPAASSSSEASQLPDEDLATEDLTLDVTIKEESPKNTAVLSCTPPPVSKLFKNESPELLGEALQSDRPHSKAGEIIAKETSSLNASGARDPTSAPASAALSKRRRKKTKVPWDVVIPIAFGMTALWFGNQYYFGGDDEAVSAKFLSQLVKGIESEAAAPSDEDSSPPIVQDEYNIQATKSNSSASVKWRFARTEDKRLKGTFEISTPPSRELSKEEIADGVKREPWLKKVDLGVINTPLDAEGRFDVKTSIKAYVEDNSKTLRVSGTATLKGQLSSDNQLTAEVTILSGIEVPPVGGKYFIERMGGEKYRFYLRSSY